jgi:hypothetical protein
MQIRFRLWYIVAVFRLPGVPQPACLGIGLGRHRERARAEAIDLAAAMVAS